MSERFAAPAELREAATALGDCLRARAAMVATAESCTGGLIAATLTDIAGSSSFFWGGWVTYANAAKRQLLGVPPRLIEQFGAVSAEVAEAMARGALAEGKADYTVAVTGVAGPDGGTPDKPVGLVWFGFAGADGLLHSESVRFPGDRAEVRTATARHAIERLLALISAAT